MSILWTPEEVETAIELYDAKCTYGYIGRQLGRTAKAVEDKLRTLNAVRQDERSDEWRDNCPERPKSAEQWREECAFASAQYTAALLRMVA